MGEYKTWGKDGKEYDNPIDKFIADSAWEVQREEQRKQNKLLAEQNRLIQQQAAEKAKMEQQKMAHEQQMQQEQIKHEENMRILNLFDTIGMNKENYDAFLSYLFDDAVQKNAYKWFSLKEKKETAKETILEIDELLEKPMEKIEDYRDKVWNYDFKKNNNDPWYKHMTNPHRQWIDDELENCYEEPEISDDLIEKYHASLNDISVVEQIDIDDIQPINQNYFLKLKKQIKSSNKTTKISGIVSVVGIICLICLICFANNIFGDNIDNFIMLLSICLLSMIIISLIYLFLGLYGKSRNKKDMYDLLSHETSSTPRLNTETIIKKFKKVKEEYVHIDDKIKQAEENLHNVLLPKWNNFVEFRKNHYNSQIEKLLLDLKLKEQVASFGVDYPKINNGNKTGDGTIEDYIEYFDSLSE